MSMHNEQNRQPPTGYKPPVQAVPPQSTQPRHTQPQNTQPQKQREGLSRRRFMQGSVLLGALAAGGGIFYASGKFSDRNNDASSFDPEPFKTDPLGSLRANANPNRVLILIELAGGNDGLSTVIPYNSATYYDLRPSIAIPGEEVLRLDDEVGLHPNLSRLHKRGIGIVEGVGSIDKHLSHFDMEELWQRGDVTGKNNYRSGFCARLVDPLDQGSPIAGLALGGHTPYFDASRASTLALSNASYLTYLSAGDPWKDAFHSGLKSFDSNIDYSELGMVGESYETLLGLGNSIGELPEPDEENSMITEGGSLGRQLNLAADLIRSNIGVRVIHARLGGFDTHTNQVQNHGNLMANLDAACDGFLQRAENEGFADNVLLATVSEFGRRVPENNRGTDHGAASVMLLAGATKTGRLGQAASLVDRDKNDNLKTMIPFNDYLGGLAEWCGIEAGSILPEDPEPIQL